MEIESRPCPDMMLDLIATIVTFTMATTVLVIGVVITIQIRQQARDLGVLRALGFASRKLRRQILAGLLPPLLLGATLGGIVGWFALAPGFGALLVGVGFRKVESGVEPQMILVVAVGVVLLGALVAWGASARVKRISAHALITEQAGDRWAGVPRPPIGSFCYGAPRAEFSVKAEDAIAVIADQFDPTDDRGDRGSLLDLLADEPVQQWQSADVVGGVGEAVEATDGLRHLLLVGEGGLEGFEDHGDVLGLGLDGVEQRGGVTIQHVGDELARVYLLLGGLGLELVRDARQIEGTHVDGKLLVHNSSLQLHGDLSVERFFEFSNEFHARETNFS